MGYYDDRGEWHEENQDNQNSRTPQDNEYWRNVRRENRKKMSDKADGWHWILIILGFCVAWPIGLILLFLQLANKWPTMDRIDEWTGKASRTAGQAKRTVEHAKEEYHSASFVRNAGSGSYSYTYVNGVAVPTRHEEPQPAPQQPAQNSGRGKSAAKHRVDDEKLHGYRGAKLQRIFGWIITVVCGTITIPDFLSDFYEFTLDTLGWAFHENLTGFAFTLIGVVLLCMGYGTRRKLKRFRKYLSLIGDRDHVPISSLAAAMGVKDQKAIKDLEEMLDHNYFESGYVDMQRQMLILSDSMEDIPLEEEPEKTTPQETMTAAEATLQRIRAVNDAIPNPELTQKIYRIEELTGKIFELLEQHPEKAGELRRFMNYYLPQTLKILESYARMDAQGVEGENITEAKNKIENMMDKLIDGYETQIDQFFASEAMDISADIEVMEQMLAKDGLTEEETLHF